MFMTECFVLLSFIFCSVHEGGMILRPLSVLHTFGITQSATERWLPER